MKVDNLVIQKVLDGMREKGLSQKKLASRIGMSRAWLSRLLNGDYKSLDEEIAGDLEAALGIQFWSGTGIFSELGQAVAGEVDRDPMFAELVMALLKARGVWSGAGPESGGGRVSGDQQVTGDGNMVIQGGAGNVTMDNRTGGPASTASSGVEVGDVNFTNTNRNKAVVRGVKIGKKKR